MSGWTAQDWTIFLGAAGALLGILGKFIVDMATLRKQIHTMAENVQKIEIATNSMKDALVVATREQSLLEGASKERQEEEARKALKASGLAEGPLPTK